MDAVISNGDVLAVEVVDTAVVEDGNTSFWVADVVSIRIKRVTIF